MEIDKKFHKLDTSDEYKQDAPTKEQRTRTVTIPKNIKYLSDYWKTFPSNVFINKQVTGIGATTLALESKEKYIIAVPYRVLALNKIEQYKNKNILLVGTESGANSDEIERYRGDKVIVVYDSIPKLVKHLQNKNQYRLLIDEAHVILQEFRATAMNNVMRYYKEFKDYIFLTATPQHELLDAPVFKDMDICNLNWLGVEKVNFTRDIVEKTDKYSVLDKIILICAETLRDDNEDNVYIFVNSVKMIEKAVKSLMKTAKITHEDVNLIISEGNSSRTKVNLGKKFEITQPPTKPEHIKKINFITSTAFEGADFYDENGKIFIISDGTYSHTKIDIMTQMHQIAGRIRNSKYKNDITIITAPNDILQTTDREEYRKKVQKQVNYGGFVVDRLDRTIRYTTNETLDGFTREELIESFIASHMRLYGDDPVYVIVDGNIEVNTYFVASQLNNWDILHQSFVYVRDENGNNILKDEKKGVNFIDVKIKLRPDVVNSIILGKTPNYRELMKKYIRSVEDENNNPLFDIMAYINNDYDHHYIEELRPDIKEAYDVLGTEIIRQLNYVENKPLWI